MANYPYHCRFAVLALTSAASFAEATCLGTVFRDGFEDVFGTRFEVELVVSRLGNRSASFQLNDGETITAEGDGTYCFTQQTQGGQAYEVAVKAQPETGGACGGDLTGVATSRVSIEVSCDLDRTNWDEFNWDEADWN